TLWPRNTRTAPVSGATGVGNAVGSVQGYATARPVGPGFTTDTQGAHTHANGNFTRLLQVTGNLTSQSTDNTANEPDPTNTAPELSAGAHAHTVTGGGDNESRPSNAYVNYIIKN